MGLSRFWFANIAVLIGTGVVCAHAATIHVDNRSGKAVTAIMATPKGEAAAETNLLGESGIAVGAMGEMEIAPGENQCVFDLKISFADNSSVERPDMDICQTEMLIVD